MVLRILHCFLSTYVYYIIHDSTHTGSILSVPLYWPLQFAILDCGRNQLFHGIFWSCYCAAKLLNHSSNREWYSRLTDFEARQSILLQALFTFEIKPLSSKTLHNSKLFGSVKLQQPTIFKKWLRQALHCPFYSILVTRSLQIHGYWH